ncbi:MAG TPA: magnesium transporter CorA family protein [Burkholderiaceae bacterium]
MRVFHVHGDQFAELSAPPELVPAAGYLWIGVTRTEFEAKIATVQAALQRWTGGQLVDLHVSDLLNSQLPSNFDYTSLYDLLVFRRLVAGADSGSSAMTQIDTNPVGFAVFDRVLLTVHPADCLVREFFAGRLQQQQQPSGGDARGATRMPPNPADLALRMVNFMVDSYLELRRRLTKELDQLQRDLFGAGGGGYAAWQSVLDSRNNLHLLEDTCEDQRAAITEWIDAQDELPPATEPETMRERELLRVRSRDVQEHIERVLTHVRRLEAMAENAVQMHFSAQGHRTNEIMRTLTVLTAIFLPLNLLTGFFGMNFEGLPLIHSPRGFWIIFSVMLALGIGLSWFFWRKRLLTRDR